MVLAASQQRQLDRGGRLARALQADEHQHRRRRGRVGQAGSVGAQQLDQLLVHRLDHLLRRGQARRDLHPGKPATDVFDELFDDLEVDVCLQKGEAYLAQARVKVLGAQHAAAGDLLQRLAQPGGEGFEHQAFRRAMRCRSFASSRSRVSTARRRFCASASSPRRRS